MTRKPTKSVRTARSFALLLPFAIAPLHLCAQSQPAVESESQPITVSRSAAQPPLQFEVASIRPHRFAGDEPSERRLLPGGRFVATATTARTLLRIAFGIDDNRMSGVPAWVDNETFDIDATVADHVEVTTSLQLQQLVLSLLEDRFHLRFHLEQREGSVYWLKVDKPGRLGPALKPSNPASQPNMSVNSNGLKVAMKASKAAMADIAAALRRQAGRPVEDHTDLKGDFDFQIEWAAQETPNSTDPSFFTVLKEQLGLKLQPAKGTIETLVIDQMSLPSAN